MHWMFAVILIAALTMAACLGQRAGGSSSTVPEAIQVQQAAWEASGITDYRIVYEMYNLNGMGGSLDDGRFDVSVRNGRAVECTIENGWGGKSGPCDQPVVDPVDRIFGMLKSFDAEHTAVRYDSDWHFPERIDYDEPDLVDEEYTIRVLDFELLGDV